MQLMKPITTSKFFKFFQNTEALKYVTRVKSQTKIVIPYMHCFNAILLPLFLSSF